MAHKNPLNRRAVLGGLASSTALGMTGCGYTPAELNQFLANCKSDPSRPRGFPPQDDILRIDMHCHLMNSQDSDRGAFANRRLFRTNPGDANRVQSRDLGVRALTRILQPDYATARSEANKLLRFWAYYRHKNPSTAGPEAICNNGLPSDLSLVATNDGTKTMPKNIVGDGRATGFVSDRTRNAALLMAQFPQVDLFLPSIVDFYEGNPADYTDPVRQMQFHSALAIVSGARFLPLVSFNPIRYAEEVRDKHALNNIDLVRESILKAGAVGVKLHPSSGFDPLSNVRHANYAGGKNPSCSALRPDGSGSITDRILQEEYDRVDEGMEALFALCHELDVPILTHSGTGINTFPKCMEAAKNPDDWTNSSAHWIEALKLAQKRGEIKNRVVLAHFAGGFHPMTAHSPKRAVPPTIPPLSNGQVTPGKWLETSLSHMANTGKQDLFLDLSIMTGLAMSQAKNLQLEGEAWEFSKRANPLAVSSIRDIERDGGAYARAFKNFFSSNRALHSRTMYGSDWHMPAVSAVSGHDAYLRLIESLVSDNPATGRKVMGLNAADFFGLREGRENRTRIETFLRKGGVDPKTVGWMQKLDRQS